MLVFPLILQTFIALFSSNLAVAANSKLFREYIGAEEKGVKFSDVPVNSEVDFHFILSFAIDYTTSSSPPSPTNGNFRVYWDTENLSPSHISSIKAHHPNVKVAMSLGGDTIKDKHVKFSPETINSWVRNAIHSITEISMKYHLDGIDIDYEHFHADPDTFAECIGRLLFYLKQNGVVSFASIAPYNDDSVQPHYLALWRKYGHLIDYVNFQFYTYDKGTTISEFLKYFDEQSFNYRGGKVLVSFGTDGSGGLSPKNGFFEACRRLKHQGKLHGIFVWSADDSKKAGFQYEKQSQTLLARST
ncbi:2S globulin [Corchorus capsularis]|uniref:2S globulin n=1 Tax=Corchorus capsularis TaxID=210143 RepID=A0A1R3HBE6_COCAP|nr:2S globulin [Corchorus capsularis]